MLRFASASLVAVGLLLAGCGDEPIHDEEPTGQVSAPLGANATVNEAITGSCTTTAVKGLATQLVEEIQCLRPGTMKRIDNVEGLNLGEAVFPYLQTPAADALMTAQKARNVPIALNSGLRTLPQQFLLYRWYKTGRCGIGLAATPGTSNHESAIAVDVQDNAAWRSALQGKGFRWLGASDPVHYDFTGKGAVDIRGLSVQAFQRLWNRNHPDDKIGEDGQYGAETEKRLATSPANGFPTGAKCDEAPATTMPAPPITSVPESPDAEEPSTTTQKNKSGKGGDEDEDEEELRIRQRASGANAGCNLHGSPGGDWALLIVLGAVMTAVRRRAR
ncbi:MAG: M15 family metallopeptidase [Labilithrix sp.]